VTAITYIVPSYNQGQFIAYTLDSIILNMNDEDQLIIADGASVDDTAVVVEPYLVNSQISYFSEKDRGFSDAVAKALRLAKNPLIGIMSSDDAYKPGIRQSVVEVFEDPLVNLVYANYDVIDIENKRIATVNHRNGTLGDILSLRVLLPQSSVFFRRSKIANIEVLNIEFDYVADVVLFNQICCLGDWKYVPAIWSEVRRHGGSRTGTRNPGTQYLRAVTQIFAGISQRDEKQALLGGAILEARYNASSGQRWQSLASLIRLLAIDPRVSNHWLFWRTCAYIFIGPVLLDKLKNA
jgi:glycosyltransferase involved in cell wall biosynthesis